MQTKTVKSISISIKSRDKLKEKYHCSQSAVYNALAFRTMNQRAKAIREDAMANFGGVISKRPIFS